MAKGKYAGIIDRLPRLPGEPTERQVRIDAERNCLLRDHESAPDKLAGEYRKLRRLKAAVEDALSAIQERVDAAEAATIAAYEATGIDTVKFEDGASISSSPQPYAKVTDRDVFRAWVVGTAYAAQLTLPWMTLNAVTKDLLLAGEALPPGVEVYAKPGLSLRGDQ
jgi:hypothetical protein